MGYAIVVYDFNVKRVSKALRTLRKYLHWVQNSVFEGEITEGKLRQLELELRRVMDETEDSVIIYYFRTRKYQTRRILGLNKGPDGDIMMV